MLVLSFEALFPYMTWAWEAMNFHDNPTHSTKHFTFGYLFNSFVVETRSRVYTRVSFIARPKQLIPSKIPEEGYVRVISRTKRLLVVTFPWKYGENKELHLHIADQIYEMKIEKISHKRDAHKLEITFHDEYEVNNTTGKR